MSKKVVIAGACRTAIGKMGGALSTTPAPVLGSIVIKEALNRAGVPVDQVDHVYMGCVIQAGLGQNVARQAALKAGLPIETPAVTVNVVCGSGLNCVNMAAQMIQAGDAEYTIIVHISSPLPNLSQCTVNVHANDKVMVVIQTSGTDGKWITQKLCKVKLDKGFYNLELEHVMAGMNVGYIEFKKIPKKKAR